MLEELKKEVYDANMELQSKGMVIYTWGNVSGIDRERQLVVIKPSGVDYDSMKPEDMVVVDLEGNIVEGVYKPSSDTATHLFLYKSYPLPLLKQVWRSRRSERLMQIIFMVISPVPESLPSKRSRKPMS